MSQIVSQPIVVTGLPAFRDNQIWCIRRGLLAVVVDPGEAGPVIGWLKRNSVRPVAILLTHHHADHVGGVPELVRQYPGLAVYGPAAESITGVSQPLSGGERLRLLNAEWQVMVVPGHTRGHLAYRLAGEAGQAMRVFSGDVLFGLGCGRLFEGTPAEMAAALGRLAALPDETLIHCAHEYTLLNLPFAETVLPNHPALRARAAEIRRLAMAGESTLPLVLGEEKACNPFLRCTDPAVVAAAQSRARSRGGELNGADPVAVFAVLREWRNQF